MSAPSEQQQQPPPASTPAPLANTSSSGAGAPIEAGNQHSGESVTVSSAGTSVSASPKGSTTRPGSSGPAGGVHSSSSSNNNHRSGGTSAAGSSGSSGSAPSRSRLQRALDGIRAFLDGTSCYDILPESFRLIVFDNKLPITRSLQALVTNGVVSAPLYDSTTQRFAGMFTLADVVHLIQYYYLHAHEYDDIIAEVDTFQLGSLRQIEQAIDVPPPPTIAVNPEQPLADACLALVRTHARRLPLVDRDETTGKETIVSVLTQYRVLKFIAINCPRDCARLDQSIGSLGIGAYVSWYDPYTRSARSPPPPVPDSTPLTPIAESGAVSDFTSLKPSTQPAAPSSGAAAATGSETPSRPGSAASDNLARRAHARSRSASRGSADGAGAAPSGTSSGGLTSSSPGESSRGQTPLPPQSSGISDKFHPLATATMDTSVFDIVHAFSERGISAVPIVDEDGVVLNMYETVDIVDLVRTGNYDVLDKTVGVALAQRAPDFTGVITCTPDDTLASVLSYIRERRIHRFVIVEGEHVPAQEEPVRRPARKKGALVGILSLSDVLRFLVGHEDLKGHEVRGLGLHGLRGSDDGSGGGGTASAPNSAGPASLNNSRRGSEATEGENQVADATPS